MTEPESLHYMARVVRKRDEIVTYILMTIFFPPTLYALFQCVPFRAIGRIIRSTFGG